jgi:apolipoprotein N-acyltransferase
MRPGVVICYEVLFPHLVRELVAGGADLLVNVSNDSWLDAGDGAAPAQHFSMAVFRAIETRRFLVRAATTGVSGVVTPVGEVATSVRAGAAGTAVAPVVLRRDRTFYARWGDAWVVAAGVVLAAACARSAPRARR